MKLIILLLPITLFSQIFNPTKIKMHWKDNKGNPYVSFEALLGEHPNIKFAMNAGMFTPLYRLCGLFIEDSKILIPIKVVKNSNVNFGIQPQGVFCIKSAKAEILTIPCSTKGMIYATQSAPILVIDGNVNPKLPEGRKFLRNGVGLRKDGLVFFACKTMTFIEFAKYFITNECISALYLDGVISQTWTPGSKSYGGFGPVIACY